MICSLYTKKNMGKNVSLKMWKHKDPEWGLTKKWIQKYNKETWSNLKPWVDRKAETAEEHMRQWRFFTRFYKTLSWPLKKEDWSPTRLAKAATKWNKPIPKNKEDAKKLYEFWKKQIEKAKKMKAKKKKMK